MLFFFYSFHISSLTISTGQSNPSQQLLTLNLDFISQYSSYLWHIKGASITLIGTFSRNTSTSDTISVINFEAIELVQEANKKLKTLQDITYFLQLIIFYKWIYFHNTRTDTVSSVYELHHLLSTVGNVAPLIAMFPEAV